MSFYCFMWADYSETGHEATACFIVIVF